MINAIAQLVAAIGVVASLFYLAAQIRQNTRSQQSVVVDSLTSSLIAALAAQGSDLAIMRAFVAAVEDWHTATEEDQMRTVPLLFNLFKLFENAWFQQRHGTLDPQQWQYYTEEASGLYRARISRPVSNGTVTVTPLVSRDRPDTGRAG